jgi:hypothetical protein
MKEETRKKEEEFLTASSPRTGGSFEKLLVTFGCAGQVERGTGC